ncbi:MAG: lipid-A-disaccharide synthase, partial [Desulfovibrionaceae bacterium]|nr:lipid-A-disaccharide synthase [Desulfovibrionaceae bacterium]
MTARTDRLIWISAGEASGDMHGALLAKSLKALDPDLRLAGMGGPAMGEAGCELVFSMDLVSMMGGTEVVSGLPRIIRLLSETRKAFGRLKPDAVVVIDCPEVNFRVARSAHGLGIPVHYYVCPQIWAWRKGRVRLLKRYFRKVLCILPFEKDFYAQRGVAAEYVGNPLLDQLPLAELESVAPEPDRVAVLPGSRKKEVRALLPDFAAAARIIARSRPKARFSLIRAPGLDRGLLEGLWPRDLAVEIIEPEGRYRAMKRSRAALAASGTVALECALLGLPAVVAYRLSPLTFFLARLAVRIPF